MTEGTSRSSGAVKNPMLDEAIAEIVAMKPQKVHVALSLPGEGAGPRPAIEFEWTREDTNLPLSELLGRVATYVARHGSA